MPYLWQRSHPFRKFLVKNVILSQNLQSLKASNVTLEMMVHFQTGRTVKSHSAQSVLLILFLSAGTAPEDVEQRFEWDLCHPFREDRKTADSGKFTSLEAGFV